MTERTDSLRFEYIKHTLEPIVAFDAGEILSFEVVSFSENRTLLDKEYLSDTNCANQLLLFTRQLEFFQKINQHDNGLYHSLFINAEPCLFNNKISWEDFIPFIFHFRINIGFDMQSVVSGLPEPVSRVMAQLREYGVKFWIKDVDEAVQRLPAELLALFDGIKIGKQFFWQCFNRRDSAFIRCASAAWGDKYVIVEGVENKHHLSFVRAQGVAQGQGFHWRAKLARQAIWH